MVFRRNWPCRVLLWTGNDYAAGARWPLESCDLLPWRSNHGAAERLDTHLQFQHVAVYSGELASVHGTHMCSKHGLLGVWQPFRS